MFQVGCFAFALLSFSFVVKMNGEHCSFLNEGMDEVQPEGRKYQTSEGKGC